MKWRLNISRSYLTDMNFVFRKITDAEAFLTTFLEAKQPDEDDREGEWAFSISPILEGGKDEE